jgi:putative transposase
MVVVVNAATPSVLAPARCALGVLADGQCEMLGAWPASRSGAADWCKVLEDLRLRGVERIRFVVCDEPAAMQEALRSVFPGATVVPDLGALLRRSLGEVAPRHRAAAASVLGALSVAGTARSAALGLAALEASPWAAGYPGLVSRWSAAVAQMAPVHSLEPRLRRVVLSGDDRVQQLQQSVRRAVGRHGPFADASAAAAFLAQALERAERGSDVDAAAMASGAARRAMTAGKAGHRLGAGATGC